MDNIKKKSTYILENNIQIYKDMDNIQVCKNIEFPEEGTYTINYDHPFERNLHTYNLNISVEDEKLPEKL